MAVNKGLKSLVESTPNFSNQALENAINDIKTKVDRDWVTRTFDLDQAIEDNNVLSLTQKNDLKETININPYLNIGRYLNDVIRHTSTILDGTIVNRANPDTEDTASFIEILQSVQSLQTLIPNLHGVSASEKSRGVNDHLGTLNNVFLETEDSSKPVFESLIEHLQTLNRFNLNAVKDNGDLETTLDNLIAFINSVVADSTDFQQTLDNYANLVKLQFQGLNISLTTTGFSADERFQQCAAQLLADYNTVEDQRLLEISNLSGIRTYMETLSNNFSYSSLAENTELREFITKVSQNVSWKTYFNDYEKNQSYINPLYNTVDDSDKETVIARLTEQQGLYNVTDFVDLDAVANKAVNGNDYGIDSKGFDLYTIETVIKKCCEQLNINTVNNTVYQQSELLLNHLNQRDREIIAEAIDRNEDANTLS